MAKILYQNEREKATDFLSTFNTELNTTSKFRVIKETLKGAILESVDSPHLTVYAYTSLMIGSVVYASITKVKFSDEKTTPFILAVIESVIDYPDYAA